MITSIFATIFALGLLVTIHEFGHYWVAKRCGVRVLRFSVGFGKPLYTWIDKSGTEFCIGAIPLGGYVKMLDSRLDGFSSQPCVDAFDHKPVGQRFAIVAAGPAINFLFAAVLYALISIIGTQVAVPIVGSLPGSAKLNAILPAELVRFDGRSMESWERIAIAMVDKIGDDKTVQIALKSMDSGVVSNIRIPVPVDLVRDESPVSAYGIRPWAPPIDAVIDRVVPGGVAEAAGLIRNDLIRAINGEVVQDWAAFVEQVQASPNELLRMTVARGGALIEISVTPERRNGPNGQFGFVGLAPLVKPLSPELVRVVQTGPLRAVWVGVERTLEMSWLTIESIGKMLTGRLSPENLSGPLTIARVAGDTASSGWYAYLSFIAYLSVSLGVLNLLPIPVLDGGHLVFFGFEWLLGRPVPEAVQMMSVKIGMGLLMSLMFFAFYNDLMRL
jgi:regulator of sigma E protease